MDESGLYIIDDSIARLFPLKIEKN